MNETCTSDKAADTLPWIITLGVETLAVILGNIVTILVFWKKRFHLKQTTFVLINLSVADFMVGISTVESITSEIWKLWSFGCKTTWSKYLVLEEFFGSASICFLVLISLERLYAIVWPFRSRSTPKGTYIYAIGTVWLISGVAPVLQLSSVSYDVLATYSTVFMCICLATISFAYSVIWFFFKKEHPRLPQNRHKRNKDLAKTLFIVTLLSLITWLPFTVITSSRFHTLDSYSVIKLVARYLQLANSLINPIIYCFKMPMFRQTLRNLFFSRKTTGLNIRKNETCLETKAAALVACSNLK